MAKNLTRISQLPSASTPLSGGELFEISQRDSNGVFKSRKVKYSDVAPSAATPVHNNTLNIQGGASGEYYHLTQNIYDALINDEYALLTETAAASANALDQANQYTDTEIAALSAALSGSGGTTIHNSLTGLQGGVPSASEFYHLPLDIYNGLFSGSPLIGMGSKSGVRLQVDYGNSLIEGYVDGAYATRVLRLNGANGLHFFGTPNNYWATYEQGNSLRAVADGVQHYVASKNGLALGPGGGSGTNLGVTWAVSGVAFPETLNATAGGRKVYVFDKAVQKIGKIDNFTLNMISGIQIEDNKVKFYSNGLLVSELVSGGLSELLMLERSTDPQLEDGSAVIWRSDGTQAGDSGDVMIASREGGVTRFATLFDFSGGGVLSSSSSSTSSSSESSSSESSASFSSSSSSESAAWQAFFDNTRWSPSAGSWSGSDWDSVSIPNNQIILNELGTWVNGFRPSKIRVTHTGTSPFGYTLTLRDKNNSTIATNASYISATEVAITFGASDIDNLELIDNVLPFAAFKITNIEFFA